MTIQERNTFFKACLGLSVFSVLCLLLTSIWVFHAMPNIFEQLSEQTIKRGLATILHIGKRWDLAPFLSIVFSVFYALGALIFIYYYFEKTQAPEILFFAFFVMSFAFEPSRMMVPVIYASEASNMYLFLSSHLLLIGRYCGIFSLFVAGVYASGLKIQQQRNNIVALIGTSVLFAFETPLDSFGWSSSLTLNMGYAGLFAMAELVIVLLTVLSFLVSALVRGNNDFVMVAVGAFAVALGRALLLNADAYLDPFLGLVLLGIGTVCVCVRLHRVYMWL